MEGNTVSNIITFISQLIMFLQSVHQLTLANFLGGGPRCVTGGYGPQFVFKKGPEQYGGEINSYFVN